ncbi:MAG: SDR family NAD(P)-dependent oxidoreductase [Gammaproteobacteria bacterium]|nr:SDR family NAD(P)-dependent oxidoreductase [Gammaproteobacteria bacterium]
MNEFEGKTAVVTGAASGIGLALANRFADARMQVVLADIEEDALERAVQQLEQRQAKVLGVVANTMVEESVRSLAEQAIGKFGKVHILCNNAGVASTSGTPGTGIWEVPNTDWDWVLGVNFYGVLYGLQAFVPHMLEHGEQGHIVNTASLAGLMPGGGTYGVSKHGVLCLTETLYNDLQARSAAVGASVLCPGFVKTQIVQAERNRPSELAGGAADAAAAMVSITQGLIDQGKDPADIADIVFESIEQQRLYILPHPAWDDIVRSRVEHVIERGGPAALDLDDMMKRRAAGEQF